LDKPDNKSPKEKIEEFVSWREHWIRDIMHSQIGQERLFYNAAFLICSIENGDVEIVKAIFAWDEEHNYGVLKEYVDYSFRIFPFENPERFRLLSENKWGWKCEGAIYMVCGANHELLPMHAQTPLGRGAFFGHSEVLRYLISKRQADPNGLSHFGH